jgi:putative methyltransferase
VDRQAAWALQQLLRADASGKGGASIKSLTLHPSVEAKKATYAVTCQTLKLLPVLQQLLEASGLLQSHPELQSATAYVLVYEVLFGEGLRRRGWPEKAVVAAKKELQRILEDMKAKAGKRCCC